MRRNVAYRVMVCGLIAFLAALGPGWGETPEPAQGAAPDPTAEPAPQGRPHIVFDTLSHDFGRSPSGLDLKTTFRFKNAGDGVLVIEKVKGG